MCGFEFQYNCALAPQNCFEIPINISSVISKSYYIFILNEASDISDL